MPPHIIHISGSTGSARSDHSTRTPSDIVHLRSPDSTSSRSVAESITSSEEWQGIDGNRISPSESASRPRHTSRSRHSSSRHSSRRHSSSRSASQVGSRPEAVRRQSSARVPTVEEEHSASPRARRSHSRADSVAHTERDEHRRHGDTREHRDHREFGEYKERVSHTHRHRAPSEDSSGSVDSFDDPGYARHPQDYPHPHQRHPSHGSAHHGGPYGPYAAHVSGPHGGYHPFGMQHDALVHQPRPDPFAYPGSYPGSGPFSPPLSAGHQSNPFSPMSTSSAATGYFGHDPHMPPPQRPYPSHRPMGPPRPASFASWSSYYGSEMMPAAPYYGAPYGMPPGMVPGMPPYMYPHAPMHTTSPPVPRPGTDPKELDAREERMADLEKQLNMLNQQRAQQEAERIAAEAARVRMLEQEKAWREARDREDAEAKRRKEEISEASAKAKEAAEKDAAAKALKTKEEHEKKETEAKKKTLELEEAKKKLEEEIKKNKPDPDAGKPPVLFKDAMDRNFRFPWAVTKTWKGMESLIRQAFLNVDGIGHDVRAGHYDLVGPEGDIILPQIWESVIQPGWEVSMHMWPMKAEPEPLDVLLGGMDLGHKASKKGKSKVKDVKKTKRNSFLGGNGSSSRPIVIPPPPPGAGAPLFGAVPPPPMHHGAGHGLPAGIEAVEVNVGGGGDGPRKANTKAKATKKEIPRPALTNWFAGGGARRR